MASAPAFRDVLQTVDFEDLSRTLESLIASGRIGESVTERRHWQFAGNTASRTCAARAAALLSRQIPNLTATE